MISSVPVTLVILREAARPSFFVILSGAVRRSEGSLRSFGPYGPQDDGRRYGPQDDGKGLQY